MGKPSDRNSDYMYQMWGTDKLVTDYDLNKKSKMLREINHDDMTPKKHDFIHQNEIHEKIRNDEDYDDWEYGTEPIPSSKWL
jgi:phosphopantothenoylcysteine synthetase/decarboxylase